MATAFRTELKIRAGCFVRCSVMPINFPLWDCFFFLPQKTAAVIYVYRFFQLMLLWRLYSKIGYKRSLRIMSMICCTRLRFYRSDEVNAIWKISAFSKNNRSLKFHYIEILLQFSLFVGQIYTFTVRHEIACLQCFFINSFFFRCVRFCFVLFS